MGLGVHLVRGRCGRRAEDEPHGIGCSFNERFARYAKAAAVSE